MFIFISEMVLLGEHNEKAYISELCVCVLVCALEHSPVSWLQYVSGLRPQASAGVRSSAVAE